MDTITLSVRIDYPVQKIDRNYRNFSTKFYCVQRTLCSPNNMVNYTSWPIILPNMKAIGTLTSEKLHSQSITISKMHENQNGSILRSHHDQSSYHRWKLSDHRPQRSCIHKVKQDRQTDEQRTNEQTEKLNAHILSINYHKTCLPQGTIFYTV